MSDTTVAGGVSAEESPFETIIHEAYKEVSLPADLLHRDIHSYGVLTYTNTTAEDGIGENRLIIPDTIYVYNIQLCEDVVPKSRDGEIKEFYLMTMDEVEEALAGAKFKPNCAVVMIDSFIRHGIISADNDEDFVEICQRMHHRLPFSTFNQET
ncbi:NUDIX domain-containing protein [Seiridium cupressi]